MYFLRISLLFMTMACSWNLYEAPLIVRFNRSNTEYTKRVSTAMGELLVDPLEKILNLPRLRSLFCDIIIATPQFSRTRTINALKPTPTEYWENMSNLNIENYQRPRFARFLRVYQKNLVLIGKSHLRIKTLPCISNEHIRWHVTFGLVNKFTYLLEETDHKRTHVLYATAIIDPRALLTSFNSMYLSAYFWYQVIRAPSWAKHEVPDGMTTVCNLKGTDHLRLCSSAFEALTRKGYIGISEFLSINYVTISRRCYEKSVLMDLSDISDVYVIPLLQCSINRYFELVQFWVLADPMEQGSIFIFFGINSDSAPVAVKARIRKIGALLNPSK